MQSAWPEHPDYQLNITPYTKRVIASIAGQTIADSQHVLLVEEQQHEPVYYFPATDVQQKFLHQSDKITFCPYKGEAHHWDLLLPEHRYESVVWSYPETFTQVTALTNFFAFYPEIKIMVE